MNFDQEEEQIRQSQAASNTDGTTLGDHVENVLEVASELISVDGIIHAAGAVVEVVGDADGAVLEGAGELFGALAEGLGDMLSGL